MIMAQPTIEVRIERRKVRLIEFRVRVTPDKQHVFTFQVDADMTLFYMQQMEYL